MCATTPVVTAVAMLVPLRRTCGSPLNQIVSTSRCGFSSKIDPSILVVATMALPGATISGFAYASYQVGPREL